jgi:hypothetical protein
MIRKTNVKASPVPPLPPVASSRAAEVQIEQAAGNATRQLEKPRLRRKAGAEQAVLQDEGANALPVSDYPLKKGPVAANEIDLREQQRSRREDKQG